MPRADIFSPDVLDRLAGELAANLVAPIKDRDLGEIKKTIIGQFIDTASRTQEWKTTFDGELSSAGRSAKEAVSALDTAYRQIATLQDALREVRTAANRPDVTAAMLTKP
jgi:hypothetical protein